MNEKKVFDAVEMMRSIRQKRHEEYGLNPELREKRLSEIRKKYSDKINEQQAIKKQLS